MKEKDKKIALLFIGNPFPLECNYRLGILDMLSMTEKQIEIENKRRLELYKIAWKDWRKNRAKELKELRKLLKQ